MFEFLPGAVQGTSGRPQTTPMSAKVEANREAREAAEARKEQTSGRDLIGAAMVTGGVGAVDRFIQSFGYEATPGYVLPDTHEKELEDRGIPQSQWPLFEKAVSEEHRQHLMTLAIQNAMAHEDQAQAGLLANMGAGMLDPVYFAVDAAAAPLGFAAKAGRLGNAARSGAVAAGVTAGIESLGAQYDPERAFADVAMAAATSFAFAGALGARVGSQVDGPQVSPDAIKRAATDPGSSTKEAVDRVVGPEEGSGTLSAAEVQGGYGDRPDPMPGVSPLRETLTEQDRLDQAVAEAHIKPFAAPFRIDMAGRMGKMKSELVRWAGRHIFQDGAGYTDRSIAVEEGAVGYAKRHLTTLDTESRRVINGAWHQYRQNNKVSKGAWGAARAEFSEEIGRAMRGDTTVSPEAQKAAQELRPVMKKVVDLARQSGLEEFNDIPDDPNYLARYFSDKGFRRMFSSDGLALDEHTVIEELIVPAMRNAWKQKAAAEAGDTPTQLRDIEESYKGTSTAAREAREMADEYQVQLDEYRNQLAEAEQALAGASTPKKRRAAERKVKRLTDKVQRADQRLEKSKLRLADALKKEDETGYALNQARKVVDGDDIDEDLLRAVAKAYFKRAHSNYEADPGALMFRPLDADSVEEIAALLKDAGVPDAEQADILVKLKRRADEAGKHNRAKRRIDIDENYSATVVNTRGEEVTIRMSDFWDNNIDNVMARYLREMVGWSAMSSKLGIKNRSQLETFRQQLRSDARRAGESQYGISRMDRMLDIGINSILGRSTEKDPTAVSSRLGRFMRDWNFARVMNQVGFTLFAEFGTVMAHAGVRNFFTATTELRRFMKKAQDGRLSDADARFMEELFAPGTNWLRNPPFMRFEDDAMLPPLFGEGKVGRLVDNTMERAKYATSIMSGMAPINTMLQRISGHATMLRLMQLANRRTISKADTARLRSWGMTEAQQEKVFAYLKGKRKIADLREADVDVDTREALAAFLYRSTRHQMLESDVSDSIEFMHGPMGKVLFQFRSFMVDSYTRHFLNSLNHLDDWRTYMMATLSATMAGLGWSARTYLNTAHDPEARREQLTAKNLFAASISQSSWSSVIPMIVDGIWSDILKNDPVFEHSRSSGLQQGIMGIPTLDLMDKLYRSGGILGSMIREDEHVTEQQMRDLWRTMFWNNLTGARNIADMAWKENFPDKQKPRKAPDPGTPLEELFN